MQKKLRVSALIVLILFALLVVPIMRYRKEAKLTSLPSRFIKGVVASPVDFENIYADREAICTAANEVALHFVILSPMGPVDESFADSASWCKNSLIIKSNTKVADYDLINLHSSLKTLPLLSRLIAASRYLFNSSYALLSAMPHPRDLLSKWDLDCRTERKTGVFNLGNKGGLSLPGIAGSAPPSFRSMFEALTVYVRVDRELVKDPGQSMQMVIGALQAGHFFNVIEAIAAANGFDARFYPAQSTEVVQMGDSDSRFRGELQIDIPFPFHTEVTRLRNGKPETVETSRLRKRIIWKIEQPGVYRVEVRVSDNHFSALPWIVTNPFYLGTPSHLAISPSALATGPSGSE
ncbi:MAG TPA: hypothetical protein ENN40_05010 [Candidatus Aminicenantes bacterium]|nr:hypothetical protein [Candidatus Aminicenantes bacterium]